MSEHEQKNETVTIKKDMLWKGAVVVLGILFVVSLFTGGFGFIKSSPSNPNKGNNNGGTNPSAVDLSPFMDKSLYPSIGPDKASTVVIEFSDFQCPFCAMASGLPSWINDYATKYGDLIGSAGKIQKMASDGKLRFIYVPMSFLGEESVFAAQAGLCANQQGKFWEMHDAIFSAHDGQEGTGKYSKAKLKVIAEGINGININVFSDCLDKDRTLSDVGVVSNTAQTAATGTPTFYVNGVKMSGSWKQLSAAIGT